MLASCSIGQKNDDFKLVEEFYARAKKLESEITFLHNITAQARGIDPIDSLYRVTRIELQVNDSTTLTLPGIKNYMKDEQIQELSFYDNIEKYRELEGLTEKQAYDSIKAISKRTIELMNELKAYKVAGNPNNAGEFIIFSVTSEYDVIYVADESKITQKYWKAFFASGSRFDEHWYYRKN